MKKTAKSRILHIFAVKPSSLSKDLRLCVHASLHVCQRYKNISILSCSNTLHQVPVLLMSFSYAMPVPKQTRQTMTGNKTAPIVFIPIEKNITHIATQMPIINETLNIFLLSILPPHNN